MSADALCDLCINDAVSIDAVSQIKGILSLFSPEAGVIDSTIKGQVIKFIAGDSILSSHVPNVSDSLVMSLLKCMILACETNDEALCELSTQLWNVLEESKSSSVPLGISSPSSLIYVLTFKMLRCSYVRLHKHSEIVDLYSRDAESTSKPKTEPKTASTGPMLLQRSVPTERGISDYHSTTPYRGTDVVYQMFMNSTKHAGWW